jgi:zinc transport system substrate-binding protein
MQPSCIIEKRRAASTDQSDLVRHKEAQAVVKGGRFPSAAGLVLLLAVAALMISYGSGAPAGASPGSEAKVKVVTTLFPLYDFVRTIGQDKVAVSLLLPPGVEAHSFEPRPSDIVKISEADLFIYTGKFMEPWVDQVLKGVTNPNLKIVDASVGIPLLTGESEAHEDQGQGKGGAADKEEGGHHHSHAGVDPHIWLDLSNAQKMVDTIVRALVQVDPVHREIYLRNGDEYKKKLAALDGRFMSELSHCAKREIVQGGHFSFGYLARRYHLTYVAALGFTPDSQPSPRQLVALVKQIRDHGLKYVFYEELIEPRVAETLSRETGATLLMLHGAHNVSKQELERGVTFLSIMEQDLTNLKVGLECTQ